MVILGLRCITHVRGYVYIPVLINTIVEPITMYMSAYIRALEEEEEKEFKDFYLEVVVSLNNPEPQR